MNEFGFKLGLGLSSSIPAFETKPSVGMNGGIFYGHWVCGKNYGYHFDGGIRVAYLREQTEKIPSLIYRDKVFDSVYGFYNLDLGAYFKIKSENFHRDYETHWLFGLKLNYAFLINAAHRGSPSFILKGDSYRTINPIAFGIHLSPYFRFPTKKKGQSWFLNPGIEYYPSSYISNPNGGIRNFYLFLNYARTIWTNK